MKRLLASCAAWSCWCLTITAWSAPPPADELLPASTKGLVRVPNVTELRERWDQTQLGQLTADPVMQPFMEDLEKQIREKFIKDRFNLTLSWDEVAKACAGELAVAAIEPEGRGQGQNHASVLLADTTGRQEDAQRVLEEAARQLTAKGGKRRVVQVAGQEMVVYDLPRQRGKALADHVCHFLVNDLLVLANHEAISSEILKRYVSGMHEGNLASSVAYRRVMDRVAGESDPSAPQIAWFVDPFGYAELVRATQPGPRRGKDMLAILKAQRFDAILGVGGWVSLITDGREMVHRTFIYAPGDPSAESRFELAARMLQFPNREDWVWPDWLPRELSSTTMFQIETREAFEYSASLVNAIADSKSFFEDLLASLRDDASGPQIDVRQDFVAHLGNQVTVVADHTYPITPQSERILVAVAVTDEEAVRKTLHKAMVDDPDARRLTIEGYTVWEYLDQQDDVSDDLVLSIDGVEPLAAPPADDDEERILKNVVLTVAHGQFMVATHADLLSKILAPRPPEDRLELSEDVRWVTEHLERLGAGNDSLRSFSRTDETSRPTYELIRQGKMPQSESLLGRILNELLGPEDEDSLREQKIDGSKLPDFQAVRRYMGPAGLYSRSEDDGWFLSGVLLNKQALVADGGDPGAGDAPAADGDQP